MFYPEGFLINSLKIVSAKTNMLWSVYLQFQWHTQTEKQCFTVTQFPKTPEAYIILASVLNFSMEMGTDGKI